MISDILNFTACKLALAPIFKNSLSAKILPSDIPTAYLKQTSKT